MSPDNPFLLDANSFAKGRDAFRHGLLSEAVLALEAECQRNPGNAEAWRLLGTVQVGACAVLVGAALQPQRPVMNQLPPPLRLRMMTMCRPLRP